MMGINLVCSLAPQGTPSMRCISAGPCAQALLEVALAPSTVRNESSPEYEETRPQNDSGQNESSEVELRAYGLGINACQSGPAPPALFYNHKVVDHYILRPWVPLARHLQL